jgi:tripartite-type tricarboxylate transporter receptor subunit TctC
MPADIVEKLKNEVEKSLASKDMRTRLDTAGFEVAAHASPQEFLKLLQDSVEIYRKITAQAGITPE